MKNIFLFTFLVMHMAFTQAQHQVNQRKTANGIVEGTVEKSGILSFKGIPYAAPPVGDLRWKAPQPASNWDGVRKAASFGPRAMQPPIFGDMVFRSDGMSEDCLYLNVWTPAKKAAERFPVLVYFYGGGLVAGDGSEPRYDGENMARKGIVTLTVNYRLGVFGFLSHPGLTAESPVHASGNYGFLDQAAALKWVWENIAAFGGDPERITIAGESAGSISVSALMASPLSRTLIAGAIGESGSLLGTLPAVPLSNGESTGKQFAESVNASSLADLRALPAEKILEAATKFGPFRISPVIDGYFLPESVYNIYAAGKQSHVPLLAGWNSEESNYRGILENQPPTKENFAKAVQRLYGEKAAQVLETYQAATDAAVEQVAGDLASDRFIGFSTWKWIDQQAKTSTKPVYRYLYSRPRPGAKGAVHSAEIEYALGNLATNKVFAWTPDDYKVSAILQDYFANFIKKGNPNGKGLPEWPAIQGEDVPVMNIDVKTQMQKELFRKRYVLLDGF